MAKPVPYDNNFEKVYEDIRNIIIEARKKVYKTVNFTMVMAYWETGRRIVEEEQKGEERAGYGENLIKELANKLQKEFGKGFNKRNLWYMKSFYLNFPKVNALRTELTWTHYRLLLRVEKPEARNFYMIESINSNWSTRELERQICSLLYERIALSKDREKVKELSTEGPTD